MSQTKNNLSSQATVSDTLQESLSALMDGEASELEIRRLLKSSDEDFGALRQQWSRYHLASATNQPNNECAGSPVLDLSLSISDAIAQEPAHGEQSIKTIQKASIRNMWSGVGRFAIAASVAGAVVLGVQFSSTGLDNQIADNEPVTLPSTSAPSSFGQGIPSDTTVSTVSNDVSPSVRSEQRTPITLNEETKEQLKQAEEQVNRLMLEHAQNASQNTQQGVLPYARVPENSAE